MSVATSWMKESTVRRFLEGAVLALFIAAIPGAAHAQSAKSVGGAGRAALPAGAAWKGVPLSGLRFGTGVTFGGPGVAKGALQTTLLSIPVGGATRQIKVTGEVTAGSSPAGGPATFSGLGTVDPGDGTAALLSVPFSLTVAAATGGGATLTLTLDGQTLPAAVLTAGNVVVN